MDAGSTYLYRQIADNIERKIESKDFRAGEKLPSVRNICRELGVSMSTVLEAYYYLEGRGYITSRPKSGYFVRQLPAKRLARPEISTPGVYGEDADVTNMLVQKIYRSFHSDENILFSVGVPGKEFLPVARLDKEMVRALRSLPGSGTLYESVQGNVRLRRQIALQSINWNGNLTADDIIITTGCMEALSLSLMTVVKAGDCIATESPVYFGLLQLARGLGLNVIELPTDAQTGVCVRSLMKLADEGKIQACCLISNFNNPLGSSIPAVNKREITEYLSQKNIPVIEDDLYADLFFGLNRPLSCKSFDKNSNVIWCGSVSKTLAPGYRVGWVAPGKYLERMMHHKLVSSVSSATLQQEAVATFLESGRYENHLRKLRGILHTNCMKLTDSVSCCFPEGTRISAPGGGFMLWVELPDCFNTTELYDILMEHKISIAPGRMFTLQNQYENCMRLSFGMEWNETINQAVKVIGRILTQYEKTMTRCQ